MLELPLTPEPAYTFDIQLVDTKYTFDVKFNDRSGVWTFDLLLSDSKTVLLQSIPLVLGADVLEPYNLGIGAILAVDTGNYSRDAGPHDLGERVKVFWFDADEAL